MAGVSGRIVLASASPRRRDLLRRAGVEFEVRPADVDEALEVFTDPERAALELAVRKSDAGVAALAGGAAGREDDPRWVIGADTVVALSPGSAGSEAAGPGWGLLGKPEDEREARAMLERLSDTRHAVVTGVAVTRLDPDGQRVQAAASELTWVTMRPILAGEVTAYVESGEWRGKAGGYAIQETADAFVTALEGGGFDNVVGLPVALTLSLLGRLGAPLPH